MISVDCCKCGDELNELGGLLFSPPNRENALKIQKYHLCRQCFGDTMKFLDLFW